ncbi:hypothetical protein GCM10009527_093610 [Actinomadura nitritigenes]
MGINTVTWNQLDMTCLAAPTVPGLVRSLVEFRLVGWALDGLIGDVSLVAGELVANAVRAAPYREIRVRFDREVRGVVLAVWDPAAGMPVARPVIELEPDDVAPDPLALDDGHDAGIGGWGLPIVQSLASECGVEPTPPAGKWVWARFLYVEKAAAMP